MNRFKDKRILVTGASKGLGKSAASAFEKEGANVVLAARSENELGELMKSFSQPEKHLLYPIDLLESDNIVDMSTDILRKWGGIDILLHCVGGSLGINETLVNWGDFSKCLKANLGIASELNRLFVPAMKEQRAGNIIHIGSTVAFEARASVPYNTAKAALSGYVRSLGKELADHGIIVAGILPGAFYGDGNAMFRFQYYKPDEYGKYVDSLPQKRMPHADEYLSMLFLLSESKSMVMSGSLISMDCAQGLSYYNYSS
jgi:3-oxoacyl-[acyl-carrier protein] reductase